jgi:hypothetical protein
MAVDSTPAHDENRRGAMPGEWHCHSRHLPVPLYVGD